MLFYGGMLWALGVMLGLVFDWRTWWRWALGLVSVGRRLAWFLFGCSVWQAVTFGRLAWFLLVFVGQVLPTEGFYDVLGVEHVGQGVLFPFGARGAGCWAWCR